MKLLLKRIFKGEYTIGHLYIDGEYFCDTLEDKTRIKNLDCSMKIYGKTAIPETLPNEPYKIEFVWWEKHNKVYPKLIHVPCFESILIHAGSNSDHTEGCILVGINSEKGKLTRSGYTFLELMKRIRNEKNLTIEIV